MIQFRRGVLFKVRLRQKILIIKELRISFQIKKSRTREQNKLSIKIYNLSKTTQALIKDEGVLVELYAGYNDDIGLIFRGDIREVHHVKKSENTITTITAGDGDNALTKSVVNITLPANSSLVEYIKSLVSRLDGIKVGAIVGIDGLEGNYTATTFVGSVRTELDRLAKKYDFSYTIDNHIFNLVRNGKHTGMSEVISVESGMLDAPIATEKGVIVRCLLNNNLKINDLFRLESNMLKRNYRIDELEIKGDTHGSDWYSEIKGVRLGV